MLKESNIGMYEGTGTAIRHYKQNRGERGGKTTCMTSTHAQAFKLMTGYRSGSVNEWRKNSGWMEDVSRERIIAMRSATPERRGFDFCHPLPMTIGFRGLIRNSSSKVCIPGSRMELQRERRKKKRVRREWSVGLEGTCEALFFLTHLA